MLATFDKLILNRNGSIKWPVVVRVLETNEFVWVDSSEVEFIVIVVGVSVIDEDGVVGVVRRAFFLQRKKLNKDSFEKYKSCFNMAYQANIL
jgi:hypothetical protein